MDDRYGKGREIMSILSSHRLGAVQTSERGKPEESSHKAVSVLVKVVMTNLMRRVLGARDAMRAVFNACLADDVHPFLASCLQDHPFLASCLQDPRGAVIQKLDPISGAIVGLRYARDFPVTFRATS
jgi:hypothetical protein